MLCNTSSYTFTEFPASINLVKNPFKRKLTEDEVLELVRAHNPDGIIAGVEELNEGIMKSAPNLKVIARCGIDLDSIDQKAAKKLNISVYRTHVAPDIPAAELTVAMILCLVRKLKQLDDSVRQDRWERTVTGLLYGRRVGIIGCQIIGTRVSYLMNNFGCSLLGYDPEVRRHEYIDMVDLDYMLSHSDIITLHMSLGKENYHLLGDREFEMMKPGALIVNTSRGGLIDEEALVKALRNKKIGGAAIDVFEEEPYRGPLLEFPENTILTPHVASFAGTYRFDIEKETMDNVIEGLRKKGVDV
ncbi:MAG: hypothetical protein AMS27_16990 [Bacteroides sp. SM23_62_1]|nr:MAG: hypothetical protein AMS27_16990 [Bacteroides sp. SM23_62_1]